MLSRAQIITTLTRPLFRAAYPLLNVHSTFTTLPSYRMYSSWHNIRNKLAALRNPEQAANTLKHDLSESIPEGLGKDAKKILKYCAYLDAEMIPIGLLETIFPNTEKLNKELIELTKTHRLLKEVQPGIYSISPELQKKLKGDKPEQQIIASLLKYINDLLCNTLEHGSDDEHQLKALINCAVVVADSAKEIPDVRESLDLLCCFLASYYNKTESYYNSLVYWERSLSIRKTLYPGNHYKVAKALNNIGFAYSCLASNESSLESIISFSSAFIKLKTMVFGKDIIYEKVHLKSLEYYKASLAMQSVLSSGGSNTRSIATTLSNIGYSYMALRMHHSVYAYSSLSNFEESHRMFTSLSSCDDIARSLCNLGSIYFIFGDFNKHLELYKQAYSLHLASHGKNHPYTETVSKVVSAVDPEIFLRQGPVDRLQKQGEFRGNPIGLEFRKPILSHSGNAECLYELKLKIQSTILNKIVDDCHDNDWDTISTYFDKAFIRKKLGLLGYLPDTIESVQMLCFEAMNLGIMKSDKKPYDIVAGFCRTYPELTEKIATEYPEFFVDGSIVEACTNARWYSKTFAEMLKKNVKYQDKEIERSR